MGVPILGSFLLGFFGAGDLLLIHHGFDPPLEDIRVFDVEQVERFMGLSKTRPGNRLEASPLSNSYGRNPTRYLPGGP